MTTSPFGTQGAGEYIRYLQRLHIQVRCTVCTASCRCKQSVQTQSPETHCLHLYASVHTVQWNWSCKLGRYLMGEYIQCSYTTRCSPNVDKLLLWLSQPQSQDQPRITGSNWLAAMFDHLLSISVTSSDVRRTFARPDVLAYGQLYDTLLLWSLHHWSKETKKTWRGSPVDNRPSTN